LLTQKQICPRIDKEVDALRSRSFTNGRDSPGVLVNWIEPGALNDAVFEIDPDETEFKEAGHIFGQRTIVCPFFRFALCQEPTFTGLPL
jgi:hypothetical protein